MTLRQDSEAMSAYRRLLHELGIDIDGMSDELIIADLQRAVDSWVKVEDGVRRAFANVGDSCRRAGSRITSSFSRRR